MNDRLRKVEALAAGLITVIVVWLHVLAAVSAGALWRDEANTVGLVTLPSTGDVWNNLQYDSFPLLWLLILRVFTTVFGPMNDIALRVLGLFVGVGIVAVLWVNARVFRHSFPLVSLALLAMSPSLIIWGDSVRAYGFGILLILLTCSLIWRFVQSPTAGRAVAFAVAALASVHTLYYNSVILLALCVAAVVVCVRRRDWKTAGKVVMIGVIAAVSMTPYVGTIKSAASWNAVVQLPDYTLALFGFKLQETLKPGGYWALTIWIEILVLTIIAAVNKLRTRARQAWSEEEDVTLFFFVALLIGAPSLYLFLDNLSYVTRPWYYLPLLALVGVCLDGMLGRILSNNMARIGRIAGSLILTAVTLIPAVHAVRSHMTNIDLVASQVEATARPGDFVLIMDWPYGVSFSRYYAGSAAWVTVPPIAYQRFHRYDLLVSQMMIADDWSLVRREIERASVALRAGRSVFIVGNPGRPLQGSTREPAPASREQPGLIAGLDYSRHASGMVADFLAEHARDLTEVEIATSRRVLRYERAQLHMARGWRP